ncbi:hypothetical protein [Ornithinimicrobium tianjinense]|uniref:ATP-dependent endonuclease n=1 Tax=Ornithinimicrobium tianjinense TaxID=1195761 RepID=A0A917BT85_9MICO|nr:hypothetical protein [Ornithinimicrobium tianjinense]GGF55877.1 hypothetical protein GCM10011366_24720 [Ornithinimicrobium tianjinense]
MPVAPAVPVLVLLEGPSDVAALDAVLDGQSQGQGPRRTGEGTAYRLVDMGGVTNVARHLAAAGRQRPAAEVLGLCDAAEAWVVVRALREAGRDVDDVADLARWGFFVCDRDLEEELIRALGAEACLALLEREGLGERFRAFSRQRPWVDRPVEDRLHRFAGVASGRKIRLARAMAAALRPDEVPPPIAALVSRLMADRRSARA